MTKGKSMTKRKITVRQLGGWGWSIIRAVIIIGICFVILKPMLSKIGISFMEEQDLYDASVKYIPKHFSLNNYRMATEGMKYWGVLVKTALVCGGVALLQLFSCLLVAYGFARFRFPFKKLLFACVILMLIVPPQIIMLPLFMKYRFFDVFGIIETATGSSVNLLDSYWPFFIQAGFCLGIKNGLYIYLLRQYFKGVPKELEEAAFVDGSGKLRTFFQIMLPSAGPMMVTVFLFGFVWQWTDSFYTPMYLTNTKLLSSSLSNLGVEVYNVYFGDFGGSMEVVNPGFISMLNNTGTVMAIIPLIVLYLICQKHFVEGIERSGIVG